MRSTTVVNIMTFNTAGITPLAAYFSVILTELRRYQRNYGRKRFYNVGRWLTRVTYCATCSYIGLSL
jgi:hypothetical protein